MELMSADLHSDFDVASFREPTFAELLADPLTRALMKADHVDADDLERRFRGRGARIRPAVSYKPTASFSIGSGARSAPRPFARAYGSACGFHCAW